MRCAALSLTVTALYVLLAVYANNAAKLIGPVYAAVVLSLWIIAKPWRRRERD